MAYYVYILRCSDGTLYTGIARDPAERVREHNHSPRAAKYTRSRRPVRLVYAEKKRNRSAALRREAGIKKLTRQAKLDLLRQAGPLPKNINLL